MVVGILVGGGWWWEMVDTWKQKYFSSSCLTNFFGLVLKVFLTGVLFTNKPYKETFGPLVFTKLFSIQEICKIRYQGKYLLLRYCRTGNKEKKQILHLSLIAFGKNIFVDY